MLCLGYLLFVQRFIYSVSLPHHYRFVSSGHFLSYIYFFFLFTTTPVSYGSSRDRGWPVPYPWQSWIRAAPATYTTARGNMGSLTHWARPGIEPASLWALCQALNKLSHNRKFWAFILNSPSFRLLSPKIPARFPPFSFWR